VYHPPPIPPRISSGTQRSSQEPLIPVYPNPSYRFVVPPNYSPRFSRAAPPRFSIPSGLQYTFSPLPQFTQVGDYRFGSASGAVPAQNPFSHPAGFSPPIPPNKSDKDPSDKGSSDRGTPDKSNPDKGTPDNSTSKKMQQIKEIPRRCLKTPEPFDGRGCSCEWLRKTRLQFGVNGWNDSDAHKIQALSNALVGPCFARLTSYTQMREREGLPPLTYEQFEKDFQIAFRSPNLDACKAEQNALNRVQLIGEDPIHYTYIKFDLLEIMDPNMDEDKVVRQVIRGLSTKYIDMDNMQKPKTMVDLISILRTLEESNQMKTMRQEQSLAMETAEKVEQLEQQFASFALALAPQNRAQSSAANCCAAPSTQTQQQTYALAANPVRNNNTQGPRNNRPPQQQRPNPLINPPEQPQNPVSSAPAPAQQQRGNFGCFQCCSQDHMRNNCPDLQEERIRNRPADNRVRPPPPPRPAELPPRPNNFRRIYWCDYHWTGWPIELKYAKTRLGT